MNVYSLCLIMSLWKLSESSVSFYCPVQSHWKQRAEKYCGSINSYFCLFNQNKHNFTEFCRKSNDITRAGHKLIVAGSSKGTLQGADCNSDFYQPFTFLSSGNSRCVFKKSHCSEEGQVVYRNGTSREDRSCRCDYTRGYDFINKPRHRCYCEPSEEDCSCHLKICQSDYILSQDYECLKQNEVKPTYDCESISTVVCDSVLGCIPVHDIERSTRNMTVPMKVDKTVTAYSITLLVIILFVILSSIGLLFNGGLTYMLRKRQIRIITTQLPLNEMTSDDSIDNRLTRLTEEDNENFILYDIIDESTTSKTFEASTIKTQNYNSYLDVTYGENTPTNLDNVGIICLAHDSTQPQSVQKTSQRSCLDESVFSGEHGQGVLGCAYSDGYLRPMSIANQNVISKTMEKQGKCLSNKDKEAQREYDEHIYDELDYDGIERSAIYDRLNSVKGTSSAINGYMFVRSPTDTEQLGINETMFVQRPTETEQLGINIQKHSKYTTCSSKRKSI